MLSPIHRIHWCECGKVTLQRFYTEIHPQREKSASESPDWTIPTYTLQAILLLIAPALYAASIYMMLGRIILLTGGEELSIIRKRWLTKVFVLGDVVSFLMQGAGKSWFFFGRRLTLSLRYFSFNHFLRHHRHVDLIPFEEFSNHGRRHLGLADKVLGAGVMATRTIKAFHMGEKIIIGGLVVQLVFFGCFIITSATFHVRLRKFPTTTVLSRPITCWETHLYVLYGASLLIFVRSLFRLIEYAQGNDGYLISHEVFLYIFDSVLMLSTMVLMAYIHPSEITALLKAGNGRAVRRVVSVYSLK